MTEKKNTTKMRHIQTYDGFERTDEGLRELALGAAMSLSALAGKSQDSKWINRAANANLHFWEKCHLAQSAGGGYSSGGGGRAVEYKNSWKSMSDVSSYDKDTRREMRDSKPDGVDMEMWAALTQEARRVSAVFSNQNYDKFVDDKGLIIQDMSGMSEDDQRSMAYGISYLEPYFVYYRPVFPAARRVTAKQLLDYYESQPGGLGKFRANLEKGYGSTER